MRIFSSLLMIRILVCAIATASGVLSGSAYAVQPSQQIGPSYKVSQPIKVQEIPSGGAPKAPSVFYSPHLVSVAMDIPLRLVAQGVSQVGSLKLRDLVHKAARLKWYQTDGFLGAGPDVRTTAVNLTKEKVIVVSQPALDQSPESSRSTILLHETLGALGYDDKDYRKSITMERLQREGVKPEKFILEKDFDHQKIRRKTEIFESGGVTSVGGGGDVTALDLKRLCIQLSVSKDSEIREAIWVARFESFPGFDDQDVSITGNLKNGFLVYEPGFVWMARREASDEIWKREQADKVISFIQREFETSQKAESR